MENEPSDSLRLLFEARSRGADLWMRFLESHEDELRSDTLGRQLDVYGESARAHSEIRIPLRAILAPSGSSALDGTDHDLEIARRPEDVLWSAPSQRERVGAQLDDLMGEIWRTEFPFRSPVIDGSLSEIILDGDGLPRRAPVDAPGHVREVNCDALPTTRATCAVPRARVVILVGSAGSGKARWLRRQVREAIQRTADRLRDHEITAENVPLSAYVALTDVEDQLRRRGELADFLKAAGLNPNAVEDRACRFLAAVLRVLSERSNLSRQLVPQAFGRLMDSTRSSDDLLCLDGISEVQSGTRDLPDCLRAFASQVACRLVLALRPDLEGFSYRPIRTYDGGLAVEVWLLPMQREEVERYVRAFFRERGCVNPGVPAGRVLSVMRRDPVVDDLARTPLFTTLICAALDSPDGRSDEREFVRKGTIFEGILERLLTAGSTGVAEYRGPDFVTRAMSGLMGLARSTFPSLDISCADTSGRLENGLLEQILRIGVLSRSRSGGRDRLRFLHPSFHEYLAARAIGSDPESWSESRSHEYDPGWHGVLTLAAGAAKAPGEYLKACAEQFDADLLYRPLWLAAHALQEVAPDQRPPGMMAALSEHIAELAVRTPPLLDPAEVRTCLPGWDQAVAPLSAHLESPEPEVRASAALALGSVGSARSIDDLLTVLLDREQPPHVLAASATALGMIGSRRAVPALIVRLRHNHWEVRRAAVAALAQIGDPSALKRLVARLERQSRLIETEIHRALECISRARAIVLLRRKLHKNQPEARGAAVRALGALRAAESVDELVTFLGVPEVAADAAIALGRLGDTRATGELLERLENLPEQARLAALRALGRSATSTAVAKIARQLQAAEPAVRVAAVQALACLGEPTAVAALVPLLNDDVADVATTAAAAIGKLGDPADVIQLPALFGAKKNTALQVTALHAMGRVRSIRVADALVAILSDESPPDLVQAVVRSIGHIRPEQARHALRSQLASLPGGLLKASAAKLLGLMGATEATRELSQCLEQPSDVVAVAAMEALGEIAAKSGGADSEAALKIVVDRLVNTNDPYVRRAAIGAIRTARHAVAIPSLLPLLDSGDLRLRTAAATTIGELGDPSHIGPLLQQLQACRLTPGGDAAAVRVGEAVRRIASRHACPVPPDAAQAESLRSLREVVLSACR